MGKEIQRMSSLERQAGGNFRIVFRCGSQKLSRTLRTSDANEAELIRERLDENLRLLDRGRLTIPPDADAVTFLLSDGRLEQRTRIAPPLTLKDFVSQYRQNLPEGALEATTLYTIGIHTDHFLRLFKPTFPVCRLNADDLQCYVNRRSRESGRRGRTVSPVTIKKELATLRSIWSWGLASGRVKQPFPKNGLRFPKTAEKPHFRTYAEIEALIAQGGMSLREQAELWGSLFLTVPEMKQVLEHVRINSQHPHLYPMVTFAALTGSRRSELVRVRIDDIDFRTATVVIHEKKRVKGQVTTRRVPLTVENLRVIESLLADHPGGPWLFCRPLRRGISGGRQLTVKEIAHQLIAVMAESSWKGIRGWHVFRHSFASNCAASGTDQRLIDRWMGHQTEEMRKRYSHLIPNRQLDAINAVFA
jgi:integrase